MARRVETIFKRLNLLHHKALALQLHIENAHEALATFERYLGPINQPEPFIYPLDCAPYSIKVFKDAFLDIFDDPSRSLSSTPPPPSPTVSSTTPQE